MDVHVTEGQRDAWRPTRSQAGLERSLIAVASELHRAIAANDLDAADHSRRCARLCKAVAEELGLDEHQVRDIRLAGALHDIGKVALPEEILGKEGPLTEEEWEVVRVYPEKGAELLGATPYLDGVADLVRACREWVDGTGYPSRLAGEEIPLGARIVSVCDAYCAMTEDRPYRPARADDEALEELVTWAGTQFDPAVVKAFADVAMSRPDLCERVEGDEEQWRPSKRGWLQRLQALLVPLDARS